jgi:TolB-like protein/Flp pilus assembly protein TadD
LETYYQTEGLADAVRISLPKGGFTPSFQFQPKMVRSDAPQSSARGERPPRLLILPFSGLNLAEQDVVTAFYDEISLYLARSSAVDVLSRQSSQKFGAMAMDLRQIAQAAQAAYIMEGSLFRHGQTYRLNMQIIEPMRNLTVWSERYEQRVEDMIVFQRDVATDIANSLRSWLKRQPAMLGEEGELALRYVMRDRLLLKDYIRGAINNQNVGEQVALGFGCLTAGHADEAMHMFSRAVTASPSDALPHTVMGLGHLQAGRLTEAFQATARGVELAPRSAFALSSLASVCLHMRNFDGAIMHAQRSVALVPEFDAVKLLLGDSFLHAGFHNTAIDQLEEACRLMDEHPVALGHLGYAYSRTGQAGKARCFLNILREGRDDRHGHNPAALALIHAGLGEVDQSCYWLDQALLSRTDMPELLLHTSPAFDALRAHPHFNALAGRLNIPAGVLGEANRSVH